MNIGRTAAAVRVRCGNARLQIQMSLATIVRVGGGKVDPEALHSHTLAHQMLEHVCYMLRRADVTCHVTLRESG